MSNFETVILSHLVFNDEYVRKTIPFLKSEYFHDKSELIVFDLIRNYVTKYNNPPSKEALFIDLSNRKDLNEEQFKEAQNIIEQCEVDKKTDLSWLIDETEKFCQKKAVFNAVKTAINILDNKAPQGLSEGAIPKLLSDALGVSFDSHIGHDYVVDYLERFEAYNLSEEKVPFDLELFNKITKGGLSKKTLTIILGGTHVGKTLLMCHMAAANLMLGKNVLYISLEMGEIGAPSISERIDANLLDVKVDDLMTIKKDTFVNKFVNRVEKKSQGSLIVKEFPATSVGASHFRYLINELKLKKNFVPDIVYIDYINLCLSSRLKLGNNINTNTYIKTVSEELRGLASEFNLPIVTATQLNRQGFGNSDPGLENTAESFGQTGTADLMFAVVTSEELEELGQLMVKQLKNRYTDMNLMKRFVIGLDKPKMRLYDVENSAQKDIVDDRPLMDKTTFGSRLDEEKPIREIFKGFK